jgi:TPR repeat protein
VFPNLETLDVSNCRITGAGFISIIKLKNLKRLNLSYDNPFKAVVAGKPKIDNTSFALLGELPGLEEINVAGTEVSADGWRQWAEGILSRNPHNLIAMYHLGSLKMQGGAGIVRNVDEGFKMIEESARRGYGRAQYELALAYKAGTGVAADPALARTWLERAAQSNVALAQAALAEAYEGGTPAALYGIGQDYKLARDWRERAGMTNNHTLSLVRLGDMYKIPIGVAQDLVRSRHYYREAARRGSALGQYYLGMQLLSGEGGERNPVEAMEYLRKSAARGNLDARYQFAEAFRLGVGVGMNHRLARQAHMLIVDVYPLGLMLFEAQGGPRDVMNGMSYMNRALAAGSILARVYLAQKLEQGTLVQKDLVRAFDYYRIAADAGNTVGQYNAGRMLLEGTTGVWDDENGLRYMALAGDKGYLEAQLKLGKYYANRLQWDLARAWWIKASVGSSEARMQLASYLAEGKGGPQNIPETIRLYQALAAENSPEGLYHLGRLHEQGEENKLDSKLALGFYQRSADLNWGAAQTKMGLAHQEGKGVAQDLVIARDWFRRATENKHVAGQYHYAVYLDEGKGGAANPDEAFRLYKQAVNTPIPRAPIPRGDGGFNRGELNYRIGRMHELGRGIEPDLNSAFNNYRIAAYSTPAYHPAAFRAAQLLLNHSVDRSGSDVILVRKKSRTRTLEAQDDFEAVKFLTLAAQTMPEASFALGELYDAFRGTRTKSLEASQKKAVEEYKKAADQNYAPALYKLGVLAEVGRVRGGRAQAIIYFQQAAVQGHLDSLRKLVEYGEADPAVLADRLAAEENKAGGNT